MSFHYNNNFNYTYQDRLGKFKIDTLFKKWRGLYEFSLQADKKNVFLGSFRFNSKI